MKKTHAWPFFLFVLVSIWLIGSASICTAQQEALGQTPPRLSLTDGRISFWRPGAKEWTEAQINTPLAPGDQLYAGSPGNLELQIASGAFVRAGERTQFGFETQEPDFLAFKVMTGVAAFDLRSLAPGHNLELDTPNATLTIDHAGYYRVEVKGDRTVFIARRGGEASLAPAGGAAVRLARYEEVVVEGTDNARTTTFKAPPLDRWDDWNYARTDKLLNAASARYVSPDVYGVEDLDRNGTWRTIPPYGTVWVPSGVPAGWAPYTTGSWVQDPYYGWTWVDTEPWGWAPYHYGRWVYADGFWCWAPGPKAARPHYAPALVAFLGGSGTAVTWVALGWGEPLIPWWGPPAFRHRPWWGGWHGPRFVNNRAVRRTTVIRVQNITVYRNARVRHGIVGVPRRYFGHGRITRKRLVRVNAHKLRPIHEVPRIRGTSTSFAPRTTRGFHPPDNVLHRSVATWQPSHSAREPTGAVKRILHPGGRPAAVSRNVSRPPLHQREHRPPIRRSPMKQPAPHHPTRPEPSKLARPRMPGKTYETARPRSQVSSTPSSHPRSNRPAFERSAPANHRPEPRPTPTVRVPTTPERRPVHQEVRKPRELPREPEIRPSPSRGRPESVMQHTTHGAPHPVARRAPTARPAQGQHPAGENQRSNPRQGSSNASDSDRNRE
jgi:hypothetical protein